MSVLREHAKRCGDNPALALAGLLLLAWLAYWPGLGSGFLFDDYGNLALLRRYGRVDDWETFWLYILSGFSGPTGRPLSYLSFLLDANYWPADPWPFKRTNVLLHLANGLLLFGFLRSLICGLGEPARRAGWLALIAVGLWLLHPFWVSTTLYAVQRMTELAALFTLGALWAWCALRQRQPPEVTLRWLLLGSLVVYTLGLMAVLSKENGALLPAFIAVLELTVLAAADQRAGRQPTRGFRWFRLLLLGLPIALLSAYVAKAVPALLAGNAGNRVFTPLERLLTEGRILWDYVGHLVLPRPYTGGLFNDDIAVSTSLFSPWTTVVAWLGWLMVAGWAVWARRARPALAAAILFFFVGQVLESSFIQLELYFEHRSYLPAVLLPLPLVLAAARLRLPSPALRRGMVIVPFLGLTALTALRADLWSHPFEQALRWGQVNPRSPRAQHWLARFWQETGNLTEAARLNERAIQLDPNSLPWWILRANYQCSLNRDPLPAVQRVQSILAKSNISRGGVATYQMELLLNYILNDSCQQLTRGTSPLALIKGFETALPQGSNPSLRRVLQFRRARILIRQQRPADALAQLKQLAVTSADPQIQLRAAGALASAGYYRRALDLLATPLPQQRDESRIGIGRVRRWYLGYIDYYGNERAALRSRIREDMRDARAASDQSIPSPH